MRLEQPSRFGQSARERIIFARNKVANTVSISGTEVVVSERPSLGFSELSRNEFSTTPVDKFRRAAFIVVGIILLGGLFYYLTRAVQSSTAHATSDDSALHY
jgi:hypothetical protein